MKGAFYTGEYRNIFKELGFTETEIEKKLEEAYQTIFYGPKEERFYHEFGDDMA
ncbi:MAG TPA: xylanase, partial [Lachnospiraceae bacterium]|nr:xylanase [Lachnospiraceae bacterium]